MNDSNLVFPKSITDVNVLITRTFTASGKPRVDMTVRRAKKGRLGELLWAGTIGVKQEAEFAKSKDALLKFLQSKLDNVLPPSVKYYFTEEACAYLAPTSRILFDMDSANGVTLTLVKLDGRGQESKHKHLSTLLELGWDGKDYLALVPRIKKMHTDPSDAAARDLLLEALRLDKNFLAEKNLIKRVTKLIDNPSTVEGVDYTDALKRLLAGPVGLSHVGTQYMIDKMWRLCETIDSYDAEAFIKEDLTLALVPFFLFNQEEQDTWLDNEPSLLLLLKLVAHGEDATVEVRENEPMFKYLNPRKKPPVNAATTDVVILRKSAEYNIHRKFEDVLDRVGLF